MDIKQIIRIVKECFEKEIFSGSANTVLTSKSFICGEEDFFLALEKKLSERQSTEVNEQKEITISHLIEFGFVKEDNGNYWINLQTHYLELILSNGFWYPIFAQVPEMSHEDEQRVSIHRIKFVHELQNLFFVLTGNELS